MSSPRSRQRLWSPSMRSFPTGATGSLESGAASPRAKRGCQSTCRLPSRMPALTSVTAQPAKGS